jgi:gamma-butyrobetaine dioxygenase
LNFQHPPWYQILHRLRNQVIGGTFSFVDALHFVRTLCETRPHYPDTPTKTCDSFHYRNGGRYLNHKHHIIELDATTGEILYIDLYPPF